MISLTTRYLPLLSLATLALADSLTFTSKAAESVEVSYSNRDYTEMSVSYDPRQLLTSQGELLLETKSGGDCWRRVPHRLRHRRSGRLVWRVGVFPCLQYSLRLVLEREGEDCVEELSLDPLIPPSEEEIIQAGYRPPPPGQAELTASEAGQVLLNFTAAPCADHYELFYESEDGEAGSKNFSRGMTEDIIYNMALNTSYSLSLTSYLGQEWNSLELSWPDQPQSLPTTSEEEEEEEEECSQEVKICPPPPEPELVGRSGEREENRFNSAASPGPPGPLLTLLTLTVLTILGPSSLSSLS